MSHVFEWPKLVNAMYFQVWTWLWYVHLENAELGFYRCLLGPVSDHVFINCAGRK